MPDRLVRDENDAGVIRRDVDMGDGTWAEQVVARTPANLLSGSSNPRIGVEVARASFFEGREFRTFREFSMPDGTHIPAGQRILFRIVVAVNTILMSLEFTEDNGMIRMRTYAGGTPTGAFGETLPIIRANTMSTAPSYTAQNTIMATVAGTSAAVNLTGGTLLDALRLKVENSSGAASSVGAQTDSERGVAAGTYYFLIENIGTGAFEGTMRLRFEERP